MKRALGLALMAVLTLAGCQSAEQLLTKELNAILLDELGTELDALPTG